MGAGRRCPCDADESKEPGALWCRKRAVGQRKVRMGFRGLSFYAEPMLKRAALLPALAAFLASAASAQAPPAPSLDLTTQPPKVECVASSPSEVVVCGERGPSPYRLDPTVLQVIRDKEEAANPPRVSNRGDIAEACGTGSNPCDGGMVPLLEPALRVVSAAVKAVQGEDWREPFRNGPDDYQRYLEARKKRAAKPPAIAISVSGGN